MKQLLLILLLSCAGCSAVDSNPRTAAPAVNPPSAQLPVQDEDAASLLVRIRNSIGSASCTESAQCKTVGVGARACGGPEGYLAYSTTVTASAPLEALAARHSQQRRAAASATGMVSTCNVLPDPGATCHQGLCRVRSDFN